MEQPQLTPPPAGGVGRGAGAPPLPSPFLHDPAAPKTSGAVSDGVAMVRRTALCQQAAAAGIPTPHQASPLPASRLLPSPLSQAAAATPLTPLAGPVLNSNPSPLRRRGYFTDVHGAGTFSRVPSLFGRAGDDRSKPILGGTSLPQVGALPEMLLAHLQAWTGMPAFLCCAALGMCCGPSLLPDPAVGARPSACRRQALRPAPRPPPPARTSCTRASSWPRFR